MLGFTLRLASFSALGLMLIILASARFGNSGKRYIADGILLLLAIVE